MPRRASVFHGSIVVGESERGGGAARGVRETAVDGTDALCSGSSSVGDDYSYTTIIVRSALPGTPLLTTSGVLCLNLFDCGPGHTI